MLTESDGRLCRDPTYLPFPFPVRVSPQPREVARLASPLIRSNVTSGTSTVSWAVPIVNFSFAPCAEVHGVASISCDYTIITGILTFNPGETTKSFTVLINDDAYVEGNETFSMQLINRERRRTRRGSAERGNNHDHRQ